MRLTGTIVAAAAGLALCVGSAEAQALDMKGTWSSVGEAIVSGATTHHPPGAAAKVAGQHRLRQQTFVFVIEGQDGNRFWGTMASDYAVRQPIIGSLSPDGKWVYMASASGLVDGTVVDNDTLSVCYRQGGSPTFMVACSEWKRRK